MDKLKNCTRASRRFIRILLLLFVPMLQNVGVSVANAEILCGPELNWTSCFSNYGTERPVTYTRGKSADNRSAQLWVACYGVATVHVYLIFSPTEFNPSVPDDGVSVGVMEVRVDKKPIKKYKFETIISTDKTKTAIHVKAYKDSKLITSSMLAGKKISFKIPEVGGQIGPTFSLEGFKQFEQTFQAYRCPLK